MNAYAAGWDAIADSGGQRALSDEVMRYIELNPVRAGMVAMLEDYPSSSYRGNALSEVGLCSDWLSSHEEYSRLDLLDADRQKAYRALLDTTINRGDLAEIRDCMHKGWAYTTTYLFLITMLSSSGVGWPARLKAASIHFGISLLVALAAALLVFLVWYPYPYREISGGRELFMLVVAVDVVMGPLMTLAIFNLKKPMKELRRDLAIIGLLQLAALAYGLWTVSVARPVHLVYEIDRFRVVHAIDVPEELMASTPPAYRQLPLTGPTLLSVREFKDSKESFDATMAALQGVNLGARPDLWQNYEKAKTQVLAHTRPLADLRSRFPTRTSAIDQVLKAQGISGRPEGIIGYVPLIGRSSDAWTVLLDTQTAEVLAFVPIDSF